MSCISCPCQISWPLDTLGCKRDPISCEKLWLDFAVRMLSREAVGKGRGQETVWAAKCKPSWWDVTVAHPWKNPTANPKDTKEVLLDKYVALESRLREDGRFPMELEEESGLWREGKYRELFLMTSLSSLLGKVTRVHSAVEDACTKVNEIKARVNQSVLSNIQNCLRASLKKTELLCDRNSTNNPRDVDVKLKRKRNILSSAKENAVSLPIKQRKLEHNEAENVPSASDFEPLPFNLEANSDVQTADILTLAHKLMAKRKSKHLSQCGSFTKTSNTVSSPKPPKPILPKPLAFDIMPTQSYMSHSETVDIVPIQSYTSHLETVDIVPTQSYTSQSEAVDIVPTQSYTSQSEAVDIVPTQSYTSQLEAVDIVPTQSYTSQSEAVDILPTQSYTSHSETVDIVPTQSYTSQSETVVPTQSYTSHSTVTYSSSVPVCTITVTPEQLCYLLSQNSDKGTDVTGINQVRANLIPASHINQVYETPAPQTSKAQPKESHVKNLDQEITVDGRGLKTTECIFPSSTTDFSVVCSETTKDQVQDRPHTVATPSLTPQQGFQAEIPTENPNLVLPEEFDLSFYNGYEDIEKLCDEILNESHSSSPKDSTHMLDKNNKPGHALTTCTLIPDMETDFSFPNLSCPSRNPPKGLMMQQTTATSPAQAIPYPATTTVERDTSDCNKDRLNARALSLSSDTGYCSEESPPPNNLVLEDKELCSLWSDDDSFLLQKFLFDTDDLPVPTAAIMH